MLGYTRGRAGLLGRNVYLGEETIWSKEGQCSFRTDPQSNELGFRHIVEAFSLISIAQAFSLLPCMLHAVLLTTSNTAYP